MDKSLKIALWIVLIIFVILPLLSMLLFGGLSFGLFKHFEDAGCCCRSGQDFYASTKKSCRSGYHYTPQSCSAQVCGGS